MEFCILVVVGGCHSAPCMNGGTCIGSLQQSYTCTCLDNYAGRNCEEYTTHGFGFNFFVSHISKTWDEARMECEERGYSLATVSTAEELSFIAHIPS